MTKILIVDDSAYARRTHRAILERAGLTVIEAATGTEAIEKFSLDHPRVVILDLSMEDIGGIEVLRTMRALDAEARVIVVSADVQRTTEENVREAGAERFVGKPANPERLVAAVMELVEEATPR
jgi:two-component system, chemotaxis family, chemotaxis protein CheY